MSSPTKSEKGARIPDSLLSPEQAYICNIDLYQYPRPKIVVKAVAGAGKTFTAVQRVLRYDRPVLLLCLNTANAADASAKMPEHVKSSTLHSHAWEDMSRIYGHKLAPVGLSEEEVAAAIGIEFGPDSIGTCRMVMSTLNSWLNSITPEFTPDFCASRDFAERSKIHGYALKLFEAMRDPASTTPITHDAYLKIWFDGKPGPGNFRMVIVDEFQDSNGLTVALVTRWYEEYDIVLYVTGDEKQAIYQFRGSKNALREIGQPTHECTLTTSRRFFPHIGDLASKAVFGMTGEEFPVFGIRDTDPPNLKKSAIIGRTNQSLLMEAIRILQKHEENRTKDPEKYAYDRKFHFIGTKRDNGYSPAGILRLQLIRDIYWLKCGHADKVKHPLLKKFKDFKSAKKYIYGAKDRELRYGLTAVNMLSQDDLPHWLDAVEASAASESCNTHITSAHRSKGFEYANVLLLGDFKHPGKKSWVSDETEINLLYIAITRAEKRIVFRDDSLVEWLIKVGCDLPPPPPKEKPAVSSENAGMEEEVAELS